MIANTNELGYQSVHSEFDPRYRNNERVMVYSKELADYIWARLATYFTRKVTTLLMTPIANLYRTFIRSSP